MSDTVPGDAEDTTVSTTQVLLGHELAMLATAVKYDLDRLDDRRASNAALIKLFFALIRVADVDVFIEAGAKETTASRRAVTSFPGTRVVAFEANPYNYRRYKKINTAAGIEYRHNALTDRTGPVTFNVLRDETGRPLVNGRSSLLKRTKLGDDDRGFEEVTVDGVALDDFLPETSCQNAAMWIDVEGAGRMVLTGARGVLKRTAVLIIEVEELRWWGEDHWRRQDVVSYLYGLGLVPVARDFEYKHQYNIVFVRADLLTASSALRWTLSRFVSQAYRGRTEPAAHPSSAMARFRRRVTRSAVLRRAFRKAPLRPIASGRR